MSGPSATDAGTSGDSARAAAGRFVRDAYVVAGSKAGAPTDPFWFTNLRANPLVTIEVGGQTLEARATVAEGADRDRLWARHVAAYPAFGEYPTKTDRVIPMARLTPVR